MKILILTSQAYSLLHFRVDMMKAFLAEGHTVFAAAPDQEGHWKEDLAAIGVEYHTISMERTGQNPIKDIAGFFSIRRLMRTILPDVLFCYHAKTVIYGLLASKVCKNVEAYALIAGLGSALRSSSNTFKSNLIKSIMRVQYWAALKYAARVYFQNPDDSGEFIRMGLVAEEKVEHINGSGVNLLHFQEAPYPMEDRFLFVGRLIKDKGIVEYLEAAKIVKSKYPHVIFDVIGYYDTNPTALQPGNLNHYFQSGIACYLGKQDDVYPYLKRSSVFVLTSYHEGTPKSVLEAMATGRAIITTDAPGCRETVINGKNGFLVPVGDVAVLAEKMIWLVEHKDQCQSMGRASRELAVKKFDVDQVNEKLIRSMGIKSQAGESVLHIAV